MKIWLLLLGCLLVLTSQAQSRREVWQWRDAEGVIHFSDYPQPGATRIVLNVATTGTTAPAPVKSSAQPAARPAAARQAQYDVLEILSPEHEASYFEPDTEIVVRVRSEPELDAADRLVTYLDGKQLPELNATEHRLTELSRGAHTVQSAIFGSDGQEKIRSSRIVFHMKQPTVANPRNQGPALRPQPKPRG